MSYTSKNITTLEGIEAIRLRPAMYIANVDSSGIHHLALEVISNSIDEALNSHADVIEITTKGKTITVTDNGRGIPFGKTKNGKEAIIEICTSLHSGGKFGQGGYSVSGGLHGIGLTAVNALSDYFYIESRRDNKKAMVEAKKGIIQEFEVVNKVSKDTGTTIEFIPDTEIFKNETFNLKELERIVQELSFLTSEATFILNGKKFKSKDGLKEMIKDKSKKPLTDIIYVRGEEPGFMVELAFQFEDRSMERIYAYTNNIPNEEGGTHVTGFKTAFTNSINKLARKYGMLEEKDENLNGDLLRIGLNAAISIRTAEAPIFKSQTKNKLMTPGARGAVSRLLTANFENSITKKDLKIIVDRAISEQKALDAAKRAREAAGKVKSGGKDMNSIKDLPSKLVDCKDRNGEVWILEGDSAGGLAKMCRNPKNQAILPLRGKVLNTHGKELADIIKNKEIKDMITAFGTGVANQFNIRNFRYSKIIILADADPDGKHINVLILTLIAMHLPELIKQGKVYVAIPPLFKSTTPKSVKYFFSTDELDKASGKGQVTRFKGIGEMNAEDLWDTTMNPETRKIVKLTAENFEDTLKLFDTLMGKSSTARRNFIIQNTDKLNEEDFFGDGEDSE